MLGTGKPSTTMLAPMNDAPTAAHASRQRSRCFSFPRPPRKAQLRALLLALAAAAQTPYWRNSTTPTNSIFVQAYTFTSAPIAKLLSRPTNAASRSRPSRPPVSATDNTPPPISFGLRHPSEGRRDTRHRAQQGHGDRSTHRHHRLV